VYYFLLKFDFYFLFLDLVGFSNQIYTSSKEKLFHKYIYNVVKYNGQCGKCYRSLYSTAVKTTQSTESPALYNAAEKACPNSDFLPRSLAWLLISTPHSTYNTYIYTAI